MNYYTSPLVEDGFKSGNPKPARLTKRERARVQGRGVGPYPVDSDKWPRISRGVITHRAGHPGIPKRTKLKGWQKQARR